MFEHETELIIDAVRQRVPRGGSESNSVVLKDILAADIPHPLKTFFRADVEMVLEDELQRHRKGSRFNFHHPEVQSLQKQISSILVLHYGYPLNEFNKRLEDTVHLMINYLIRPQWSLNNVLFEKEKTI